MLTHVIQNILTAEFKASVEQNTYSVDADHKLVVLVEQGNQIIQIAKVTQVRFEEQYTVIATDESVYCLVPDSIFGLKAGDPSEQLDKRPGFRR